MALLVAFGGGCGGLRSADPTVDAGALAGALAAEGVELEVVAVGRSPGMGGRSTTFIERLTGDVLRVFTYDEAGAPAQRADATALATGAERPRVWRRNRVVVAHYGGGAHLAHALRRVLGRPQL